MVSDGRTDDAPNAPGRRLERFVKDRWPRSKGRMRGLAKQVGTTAETLYSWFRGDSEPSMAHLRELARLLQVGRVELVAVIDGAGSDFRSDTLSDPAALSPKPDPLLVEVREALRLAQQERAELRERVEALEAAAKLRDQPDAGADDERPAPVQREE